MAAAAVSYLLWLMAEEKLQHQRNGKAGCYGGPYPKSTRIAQAIRPSGTDGDRCSRYSRYPRRLRRNGQAEVRRSQGEKAAQAQDAAPHEGYVVHLRRGHEGDRIVRIQPAGRSRSEVGGAAGQA